MHPAAHHNLLCSEPKQHVRLVLCCGQENQSTEKVNHSPQAFFQDNKIPKELSEANNYS